MPRQLPKPTGKYSVSFTDIIDKQGKDRCLMRLFYPSKDPHHESSDYFEDVNYMKGITSFLAAPDFLASFANWMWSDLKVPAVRNQVPGEGEFPVIVFSQLASQGFVVAAVELTSLPVQPFILMTRVIKSGPTI